MELSAEASVNLFNVCAIVAAWGEQILLRKKTRIVNMAGIAERDSVSMVLGRPKKSTKDVKERDYKWKLQTNTKKILLKD